MNDKNLYQSLMKDGHYLFKRQSKNRRYSHALYKGNMVLLAIITNKQFRRFEMQLKVTKERYTLNLTIVRGLHGKSLGKTIYNESKIKKMALIVTNLTRVFKFKKDGKDVVLPDANKDFSVDDTIQFYSTTYPELTTCTVDGPKVDGDTAVYEFKTTVGTKG